MGHIAREYNAVGLGLRHRLYVTNISRYAMTLRVFVNERPVQVPDAARVRDAVHELDPQLARALAEGRAYVTDGVGRTIADADALSAGAILRVVSAPPRAAGGESV